MSTNYQHIADFLTEGKPMAYSLRFDGSLAVVAANGQKFIFTPQEVAQAEKELDQRSKTAPKKPASAARKPRAPKKTGA